MRFLDEPILIKFLAMTLVLGLVVLAVGSVGLYGLRTVNSQIDDIAGVTLNRLWVAAEVQQDILALARAERNVILAGESLEIDKIAATLRTGIDQMRGRLAELRNVTGARGQINLDELDSVLNQWLDVQGRVLELSRAGEDKAAFKLAVGTGRPLTDRAGVLVGNVAQDARRVIHETQAASKQGYTATLYVVIAGILAGLTFAAGFGALILLNIYRDIRRREKAENDIRAANQRLALQSAELERSNTELEQIAYVASHDLKAPLRAIDNLATWIADDLGDSLEGDAKKNLDLLRGRVRRLEALLADLLRFSRAGRVDGEIRTVDLGGLIADMVDLIDPPDGFSVVWPGELPTLTTAQVPLEQVLGNLIGNAIKHHDRPEGRIEIAVRDTGPTYEFTVTDDGPGIPEKFHERVFQMFQSLKPRDEVEGSGMGLAIVKKQIEAQGSTIWLESKEGKRGATFRFGWPKTWLSKEP